MNIENTALLWERPGWLLLIILPILWKLIGTTLLTNKRLRTFAEPALWPWLIPQQTDSQKKLPLLAWTLAAVALSGPYLQTPGTFTEHEGIDIAVVLDISPSMTASDIKPNRLGRSQLELSNFTRQLKHDRLALVAVSASAYSLLPLSNDYQRFLSTAQTLNPYQPSQQGSNLQAGIKVATNLLSSSPTNGRAILLLSDGETHGHDQLITVDNIPVFSLGIGSVRGAPVINKNGRHLEQDSKTITSSLNRSQLQSVSTCCGGAYFDLSTTNQWPKILDKMRQTTAANRYQTVNNHKPYLLYPWFLVLALTLLLLHQKNTRLPLSLSMLFIITSITFQPPPVFASDHEQATSLKTTYLDTLWKGISAYRQKEWQTAFSFFKESLNNATNQTQRTKARYNMANTQLLLRNYSLAITHYKKALLLTPKYPPAVQNLSIATALQKRVKKGDDSFINSATSTHSNKRNPPLKTQEKAILNTQQSNLNTQLWVTHLMKQHDLPRNLNNQSKPW